MLGEIVGCVGVLVIDGGCNWLLFCNWGGWVVSVIVVVVIGFWVELVGGGNYIGGCLVLWDFFIGVELIVWVVVSEWDVGDWLESVVIKCVFYWLLLNLFLRVCLSLFYVCWVWEDWWCIFVVVWFDCVVC